MNQPIPFATVNPSPLPFGWQKLFLFLTAFLAATVLLKFASVQYLELIYFGLILTLMLIFVHQHYRFVLPRLLLWIAVGYLALSVATLALAVNALTFQFYIPSDLPALKGPVLITLSRIAELMTSVAAMVYMAVLFSRDARKLRYTMLVYYWVGFASGIYSVVSLPLNYAGIDYFGAYSTQHRLRGFYNEGGPYGVYLLSVFVVGIALYRLSWLPGRRLSFSMAFLLLIFVASSSKAAILALVAVAAINALLAGRMSQRIAILVGAAVVVSTLAVVLDIPGAFARYHAHAEQYERISHLHAKDPNFVQGRVAAAFILPRMIAAHPIIGIGWGNYELLRNAPEYRGAAIYTDAADDPGLGIVGYIAELGIPLFLCLSLLLFVPFLYLRSLSTPQWIANLALLQPIAQIFGAQLNLTYPWVVTAFALGVGLLWNQWKLDSFPSTSTELAVS